MKRMRRPVYSHLDPADYRQLRHEAAARGISLTACIADCLREYFAFRAEMATTTAPQGHSPGHTGLIHSLFARVEERLAATLDAYADDRNDEFRRLETMLDRLVVLYLVHTPEVPHEIHGAAVASANRRYGNYRQAVSELIAKGGINGAGTVNIPGEAETK